MNTTLDEVRSDIKELIRQGAIHNELLRTHEARSLALQSQQEAIKLELGPIKQHVNLMSTIGKLGGAIGVGAIVQWFVRHVL